MTVHGIGMQQHSKPSHSKHFVRPPPALVIELPDEEEEDDDDDDVEIGRVWSTGPDFVS